MKMNWWTLVPSPRRAYEKVGHSSSQKTRPIIGVCFFQGDSKAETTLHEPSSSSLPLNDEINLFELFPSLSPRSVEPKSSGKAKKKVHPLMKNYRHIFLISQSHFRADA